MKNKVKFFVIVPLGVEREAARELESVWPWLVDLEGWPQTEEFPEITEYPGGLEFEAFLHTGLQLHYWLKIPVRLLLRITSFRCRDRWEFKKKLGQINWSEWLAGKPQQFKIDSSSSKIWNESFIKEQSEDFFTGLFPDKKSNSTLYIRGEENNWQISLDLTGPPLFQRGWAPLKEQAPLRENLAYLGLDLLARGEGWSTGAVCLADPFLGSGTILAEARGWNDLNILREFSFEGEPFCPKLLREKKIISNYHIPRSSVFESFFGSEIDQKTFQTSQSNLKNQTTTKKNASDNFVLENSLFQDLDRKKILEKVNGKHQQLWILTNPPYEKRVGFKGTSESVWLKQLAEKWQPEKIAFYYPIEQLRSLEKPAGYELKKKLELMHGGLKIQLSVLEKI